MTYIEAFRQAAVENGENPGMGDIYMEMSKQILPPPAGLDQQVPPQFERYMVETFKQISRQLKTGMELGMKADDFTKR